MQWLDICCSNDVCASLGLAIGSHGTRIPCAKVDITGSAKLASKLNEWIPSDGMDKRLSGTSQRSYGYTLRDCRNQAMVSSWRRSLSMTPKVHQKRLWPANFFLPLADTAKSSYTVQAYLYGHSHTCQSALIQPEVATIHLIPAWQAAKLFC